MNQELINNNTAREQPGSQITIGTASMAWSTVFGTAAGTTRTSAIGAIGAKIPTTTQPASDLDGGRAIVRTASNTFMALKPYGTGADNATGTYRVWGWKPGSIPGVEALVWIPTLLLEFTVALSAALAEAIVSGGRFADTITVVTDRTTSAGGAVVKQGSADNSPAIIAFDTAGSHLVEVEATRGSATALNALGTTF